MSGLYDLVQQLDEFGMQSTVAVVIAEEQHTHIAQLLQKLLHAQPGSKVRPQVLVVGFHVRLQVARPARFAGVGLVLPA